MVNSNIGRKSIEIGWENFVAGMSTTDGTTDGGFAAYAGDGSVFKTVINPIANPGVYNAPCAVVDATGNDLAGLFLASAADPDASNNRYFVAAPTSNGNGKYFTWNGTALTLAQTDSTNTYNWSTLTGTSDMAVFKTEIFVTLSNEIVKLTNNMAAIDAVWWTTTQGKTLTAGNRHPMIVYENGLYIANGSQLCYWDGSSSVQAKLQLANTDDSITSLGIDPGSGLMLIGISLGANASDTMNQPSRVGYYDGQSNKLSKVVAVDDMITAFYNVGGTNYVTYGKNLGYWTGSGIQFLRALDLTFDNTTLAYPCRVTSIGRTLYVVEKRHILAYGEVMGGKPKVFYYALRNEASAAGNYALITNIGSNKLGLSFATNKFYTFDTMVVATVMSGGAYLVSLKYDFPRSITYANAIIEFATAIPTGDNIGSLLLVAPSASPTPYTASSWLTLGTVNTSQSGTYTFEFPYQSVECRSLQFIWSYSPGTSSNVCPIERMTIYYQDKS